jgi:acetyl-CoA carboxylase, biotin carboxylase subunit
MARIARVLVANRGEIAVRVLRACRELSIETVLAMAEPDRESLPARLADRTVCIGPAAPSKSYLNIAAILTAARGTAADAIHPGYGFLAEHPGLAQACADCGIVFIGPKARCLQQMGDKLAARRTVADIGIPVVPGSALVQDLGAAQRAAGELGYPVLLKAAAGGGGKGMKTVRGPQDLETVYQEASAEALAAFGDGRLYIEKFIARARHVEIQLLADRFGDAVHLFERDCSRQRRDQGAALCGRR